MAKQKYTMTKIAEALANNHGLVTVAARSLGCSRKTIYRAIEDSPTVRKALDEAREVSIDFAESALMKNIENGDTTSIIFFLKTVGKSRGYVEKKQFEHSGEMNVKGIDFSAFNE